VTFEKRTGAEEYGLPNSGRLCRRFTKDGEHRLVTECKTGRESITSVNAKVKEEAWN
jgi:hypothetical protein